MHGRRKQYLSGGGRQWRYQMSRARRGRREAPERRRGWCLGRDAVAPPQYMGLEYSISPIKLFQKINVEIAYYVYVKLLSRLG